MYLSRFIGVEYVHTLGRVMHWILRGSMMVLFSANFYRGDAHFEEHNVNGPPLMIFSLSGASEGVRTRRQDIQPRSSISKAYKRV